MPLQQNECGQDVVPRLGLRENLQETAISYLSVKPWFSVDFGSDPLICWRTILYAGANCLFMQSKAGNLAVHG